MPQLYIVKYTEQDLKVFTDFLKQVVWVTGCSPMARRQMPDDTIPVLEDLLQHLQVVYRRARAENTARELDSQYSRLTVDDYCEVRDLDSYSLHLGVVLMLINSAPIFRHDVGEVAIGEIQRLLDDLRKSLACRQAVVHQDHGTREEYGVTLDPSNGDGGALALCRDI